MGSGGPKEGVLGRSIRETEQVGYLYKIYYKAVRLLQSKSEICRAGHQEGQAGILQHKVKSLAGEFLLHPGSLSTTLKDFQLIKSGPPRLPRYNQLLYLKSTD